MNAPARVRAPHSSPAARVDPLKIFVARAEARAQLWFNGELTLHDAVDEMWAAAARSGLVEQLGADAVQRLLADCSAPYRDDLPRHEDVGADDPWDDPGWIDAARDYHAARGKKVSTVTYTPDELARLRALMADDVSLERAWSEVNSSHDVSLATIEAAEFLIQQKDPARLRTWLSKHTAQECAAILQCLERRKRARVK
jgi:hypothetical protein